MSVILSATPGGAISHLSSDRVPASALILFSSVVFTLVAFATFKVLWEIPIPTYMLIAVLGLQFASLLLGSSKVLTQLGAASLSALIAVAASLGAVFLLFPPLLEVKVAGIAGSVSAMAFIIASFAAATREDPVPVPFPVPEPLIFNNADDVPAAELIKYGEVQPPGSEIDNLLYDNELEVQSHREGDGFPPNDARHNNGFNGISRSQYEAAPAMEKDFKQIDTQYPPVGNTNKMSTHSHEKAMVENDSFDENTDSDNWVEETARVMAYDTPSEPHGARSGTIRAYEEKHEIALAAAGRFPDLKMRTRYKVIDESSGEHYGTYFSDEGFSTIDTVSLAGLIGSKLPAGELRIVKLDWSNFDEVEVHIRIENVISISQDIENTEVRGSRGQENGDVDELGEEEPADEPVGDGDFPTGRSTGPRYMIFDRRTIQPMGEYIPVEKRSRIDRLALYKMFPEYDFKTFEIDSIRWEADEVRIFIRGDKKKVKKIKAQSSKEDRKQKVLQNDS